MPLWVGAEIQVTLTSTLPRSASLGASKTPIRSFPHSPRIPLQVSAGVGGSRGTVRSDEHHCRPRQRQQDPRIRADRSWSCRLAEDVPAGPLNSIEDIFDDPKFEARENLMTLEVPEIGPVVVPNVAPKLAATPGQIVSLGPPLGNANDEIYRELLGLSMRRYSGREGKP
jgi:hypothetical protein